MSGQSKSKDKMILFKNKVSNELIEANVSVEDVVSIIVGSLPIYDEKGNLLGYMPLFGEPIV